jgi:SpoIVB peptidase S55
MSKTLLKVCLALALAAGASTPLLRLSAQTPRMPVSEIQPGMVGLGRTVFNGTRVEEFKAHVLGVIENVMGPQRNLILARLEGGPLADTGVIAGMSGSPVYIDGRLIGAVSYSLGNFSKEPIAGITPIDEMTDATALNTPRPAAARIHVDYPLTRDGLVAAFRRALNWNRPFAERPGDARLLGESAVAGFDGNAVGNLLRPIATPLVMSGFTGDIADTLGAAFGDQGFVPTAAGAPPAAAGLMPFDGPLKPGDAVGVNFVTGDLLLGGTGTVTHIDGDRVYAFGHPMYNLGPTEFPMTRAYVYTILPSLLSSTKLSTTGETIGTLLQDRATAIAGRLGPAPKLIPVTLELSSERGGSRTFKFEVVRDSLFTPLMTYASLLQTLTSYERQFGAATYSVQGKAALKDRGTISFENMFAGDNVSTPTAAYVVGPLTALIANDDEPVEVDRLDLTIRSAEQPKTATLERVWLDDPRPRAGRTVPLKVLLRTYRGEDLLRTIPVTIPANATGNLSLVISDGQRLQQAEQRELRLPQPRSVDQIIRALNRVRRNNTLYVKLMSGDAGAVVNGEPLSSLPPSVLAVLESDRSGGTFSALTSATLGEWSLPTDHAISGVRTLTIAVSAN